MTELLPPRRPLPPETRARIRARVRAGIAEPDPRRRTWVVPAVAAAAVVGVVAGGSAVLAGHHDAAPSPYLGGTGRHHSRQSHTGRTAPLHHRVVTAHERIRELQKKLGRMPASGGPIPTCASEIHDSVPAPDGFTQGTTFTRADGETSLWSSGGRWVVCDQWRAGTGSTTLLQLHHDDAALSRDLFTVSMNLQGTAQAPEAEYVAGGRLPAGVASISYRFSDGHVEDAVVRGDFWVMRYLPTSGPYDSFDGRPLIGAATEVTVAMTDGGAQHFTLSYGPGDFCAQINHGC